MTRDSGEAAGLSARAASLASREVPEDGNVKEFLGFVVGAESYALPLSSVREILRPPPVTPVPRAPDDVLGIISVRGRVTTVIDLRQRLRMPRGALSSKSRILLADAGREIFGLLVDRVLQVYRLHEDEVELASVMGGDTSGYVMGIARPKPARVRMTRKRERAAAQRKERAGRPDASAAVAQADVVLILLDVDRLTQAAASLDMHALRKMTPPDDHDGEPA